MINVRNTTIKSLALFGMGLILSSGNGFSQDGADLFQKNCAVCHKTTAESTIGPGMAGVTDKRSREWLQSWIKDSPAMISSGDAEAVAIYNEYNQSSMPPFPQLSDADITAIIDYLGSDLSSGAGPDGEVAFVEVFYTDEQVADGKKYFTGEKRFVNGGPPCITCHNVSDDGVDGGYLAKDLTGSYPLMGDQGISAMIGNAPYPAMNNAYVDNPVIESEMSAIAGYLKSVSDNRVEFASTSILKFVAVGVGIFVVLLLIIIGIWSKRKKESTKKDIFARQLKSIN